MTEEMEAGSETPQLTSGKFVFVDGSSYEGDCIVVENKKQRHGRGVYINGPEKYDGEWKHDKMEGEGNYVFASKAQYVGSFVDNKFCGQGTYTWPDGRSYVGGWENNRFHGQGKYIDAEKVCWEGEFFNGKMKSRKSYQVLT